MKPWCFPSIAFGLSACHANEGPPARAALNCSIPEVNEFIGTQHVGGFVNISPALGYQFELQLPKGVAVGIGCWYLYPGPRLEGSFEPEVHGTEKVSKEYVFEIKDHRWTLIETRNLTHIGPDLAD